MQQLKGTGIAIITPFKADGSIDFAALERLVEYWIEGKVEYLVVLGTTGESVTLTKEEKKEVFHFVAEKVNGRVPVVLGIGGNDTLEIVRSLEHFDLDKATAILSVSPYYNKPTQEGIFQHYKYFAERCPKPIILYNVPGRTSSNVLPETTLRLANEMKNIVAVKEASGNMEQIMQLIAQKPEGFLVISGDDAITLPLVAAGADGVISVVANAYPSEFSEMVRLTAQARLQEARPLHYRLMSIVQHLFVEGNPAGIKAVMKLQGLCEDHLRLPLVPVSAALTEKIRTAMNH
jgi:4-hydroxy-tetrahydrodipicolinate synthase